MTLARVNVSDLFSLSSQRTMTDEGYMVVPATLARTGVQEYRARELGLDAQGVPGDKLIRLYRPAEEVFAPDSLASFNRKPVTVGHPPENVTADNWSKYAVGDVHDVRANGNVMAAEMIVRDKAAIKSVLDGKTQLSNGYSFELDMTPGKAADGQEYDGVQRQIRGNHNAIVDFARGGAACRIADSTNQGADQMATKVIVIDGVSLEMDATQASLVEKIVGDAKRVAKEATDGLTVATKRATDAETALAAEKAATTKLIADHAVASATLTAQIKTPAQIEAIAAERAKVVGDALVLVPDFKADGKTVPAIRAEVLATVVAKDEALKPIALAVLRGIDLAKVTDADSATVQAAFDACRAVRPGAVSNDGRGSLSDPAVALALVRDRSIAPPAPLTGRALFMFREQHGGKDPAKASA